MNDKFMLESKQFSLSLDFQVFESDIEYPSNTILSVCVSSSGFSAATTMDIDIKAVRDFCNELENIYNTLKGSTKIQEAYGKQYYRNSFYYGQKRLYGTYGRGYCGRL